MKTSTNVLIRQYQHEQKVLLYLEQKETKGTDTICRHALRIVSSTVCTSCVSANMTDHQNTQQNRKEAHIYMVPIKELYPRN